MNDWPHCIVSYIDLIGIKRELQAQKNEVISIIKRLHQIVYDEVNGSMAHHEFAYSWNDSVVLLAYLNGQPKSFEPIMREVNELKQHINNLCRCYAISVKGMAIPEPIQFHSQLIPGSVVDNSKHIYIKASSMALANCFNIEEEFGRMYKKSWYVDSRIAKKIRIHQTPFIRRIRMLPTRQKRQVFMYDRDLW